jgi:hypothetical protein
MHSFRALGFDSKGSQPTEIREVRLTILTRGGEGSGRNVVPKTQFFHEYQIKEPASNSNILIEPHNNLTGRKTTSLIYYIHIG